MSENFNYVFKEFCNYLLDKAKYEDVSVMNYYNLLRQMKEKMEILNNTLDTIYKDIINTEIQARKDKIETESGYYISGILEECEHLKELFYSLGYGSDEE